MTELWTGGPLYEGGGAFPITTDSVLLADFVRAKPGRAVQAISTSVSSSAVLRRRKVGRFIGLSSLTFKHQPNTLCQNALSPCFSGSASGFAGAGCSSGLVKAQSNSSAASRKIFWEFEPRMTSP